MARSGYLYRRSSGIYVVRICVPKRLQRVVDRGEIHISTGVRDLAMAKVVAFKALLQWQLRAEELKHMNVLNIVEGVPLIAGDGVVFVADVAKAFGLEVRTLLLEASNNRSDLLCVGSGWSGIEVDDVRDVERDTDGTFVLNDVESQGHSTVVTDNLVLFDTKMASKALLDSGEYLCEVCFRDRKRRRAVFFTPGEKIGITSILLRKSDAETIRLRLASGISSSMIEAAKASQASFVAPLSIPAGGVVHKYGEMRASELRTRFLSAKQTSWKLEQHKHMSGVSGVFVELMGDPKLSEIDRPMVARYRDQLQLLPNNLYQARRRYRVTSLADLIDSAKKASDELMSLNTTNIYLYRLSEMFNWAVTEEFMPRNPAAGVGDSAKKVKREQDERGVFSKSDLEKIFGVEWFVNGKGKASKRGDFRNFQPHYYWLPLLGLYSGGRLNELAQLYLDDIKQDEAGCWYLDFNLSGIDKIEVDPKDEPSGDSDKSLKNVNSQRVVALHDKIVTLGLPEYVATLRAAGHVRLFPELRFDKVKGYGKSAGSWFNDRFLGVRLEIPRDGKKTFHSFRHMFITSLFDAEAPEATVAQLAGHERGETMSAKRYRKDQIASKLKPYIDRLSFYLPPVAPFDIGAGVLAVNSALDRKRRHPSAKGSRPSFV